MDDNAPQENPPQTDFNKLDLTQLQGFSFGTQWTQDKSSPSDRRDRGEPGGDRPRRDDRRDGGGAGPMSRDRRGFRRPAGPGGPGDAAPAGGGGGGGSGPERRDFAGGGGGSGPERRDFAGGGGGGAPRRDGGGGPRREWQGGGGGGGGGGGQRYDRGGDRGGRSMPQAPYESPYYSVTFYPEDTSFNTLVQTIRKSCRTVELFEIARTVVAKTDRFVVVVAHRPQQARPAPSGGEGAPAAEAAPKQKQLFYMSVPDGMPFESDEAAVAHVLSSHLDKFFDTAEVEIDPPKGNFQVINKCGLTGELLGPPNYHRYNQIIQQHHAAKLPRMAFDAFKNRIETLRDPEAVNQWLAKMKKATRYTWKTASKPAPAAPAAPAAEAPAADAPVAETEAAPAPAPAAEAPAAPAAAMVPTFDTLEDARMYLLTQARDKVVRTVETARVHGKIIEQVPPGEIRRAVEGALERQRKFPLDTANALRGRLRREHFTIFKKGSKGVSYVCAVKRKFRVPGQTFSDSIGALISFIEKTPMIRASELQAKFLHIAGAPAPQAAAPAVEGAPEAAAAPAEAAPAYTIEERAKIVRMQGDLMWLVREGYVTEFIDGRLFAPPPMVEARKKEVEAEEHDPENFPEAPPAEAPAPAAEAAPAAESEAAEAAPAAEDAPAPGEAPKATE